MTTVNVIIGPPGTGKTSTLALRTQEAVNSGDRPLICSLTQAAAREIVGRQLPIGRDCVGTLHSHAYAALERPGVAEAHLDDFNALEPAYGLSGGISDVDDHLPDEPTGEAPGDEAMADYAVCRARCQPRETWRDSVAQFAARWERWKHGVGLIDFTDMIELAQRCPPPGSPTVLMVDEAQDHSRLELDLLRAWARRAGRLIIVGDPWQALYTWRGAYPQMFGSDKLREADCEVLSQSYRVPRAVHDVATRWVTQLSDYRPIDYASRAEDGAVSELGATWRYPGPVLDLAERQLADGQTVMITGACSYMLTPVLAEARRQGLPFANPWRVKRGDWNPLKRSRGVTMADRIMSLLKLVGGKPAVDDFDFGHNAGQSELTWSTTDIHRWVDVLQAKGLLVKGTKSRLAELARGCDSISETLVSLDDLRGWFALNDGAMRVLTQVAEGTASADELLVWWESHMLAAKRKTVQFPLRVLRERGQQALTERPRLFIGTVHSFKGAEADTVILFPDLSPQGYQAWIQRGEAMDSVVRLFYVALTRARQSVVVCAAAGGLSVPLGAWVN